MVNQIDRRSFFGWLSGAVAALFGVKAPAAEWSCEIDNRLLPSLRSTIAGSIALGKDSLLVRNYARGVTFCDAILTINNGDRFINCTFHNCEIEMLGGELNGSTFTDGSKLRAIGGLFTNHHIKAWDADHIETVGIRKRGDLCRK